MTDIATEMQEIGRKAREAAALLAQAPAAQKTEALNAMAREIRASEPAILAANARDMEAGQHLTPAIRDRLALSPARIASLAASIDTIAGIADPVGRVLATWDVEMSGLHFEKIAVPLGVIGMIYESRPNVTADAAALCLRAGNAVILRGGSDSIHSSQAIAEACVRGIVSAGLPADAVQLIPFTDREAVQHMLTMQGVIDVIIPRGGKSLTDRVAREARVPTLLHLDGNCHMYIHPSAAADKARALVKNAKLRRTGICGALETLLVDQAVPESLIKTILDDLLAAGCELRGDEKIAALDARIIAATEEDWSTEYLAPILAIKTVADMADAIRHINHYGSHHTDAIVTEDAAAAATFTQAVDSAIVLVNASTQFADGGEFGFGGEIGIATGRLHARGPVGAPELTTYKYIVTTSKPGGALRAG